MAAPNDIEHRRMTWCHGLFQMNNNQPRTLGFSNLFPVDKASEQGRLESSNFRRRAIIDTYEHADHVVAMVLLNGQPPLQIHQSFGRTKQQGLLAGTSPAP